MRSVGSRKFRRKKRSGSAGILWGVGLLVPSILAVVFWPSWTIMLVDVMRTGVAWGRSALATDISPFVPEFDVAAEEPSLAAQHLELLMIPGITVPNAARWTSGTQEGSQDSSSLANDDANTGIVPDSVALIDLGAGIGIQLLPSSLQGSMLQRLRFLHIGSEGQEQTSSRWRSSLGKEVLEIASVALSAGSSVKLQPLDWEQAPQVRMPNPRGKDGSEAQSPSKPIWEKGQISLVVYCAGATADRLDSSGLLQIIGESGSYPSLASAEVSHAPQILRVPIGHLLAENPSSLTITWAGESSGTLLVLGMVSEPLPETEDHLGPVLVTVDTIEGKGPFLPHLYDEWAQVSSPQSPPRRFGGIWSEDVDPLRNHTDILAVWGAHRDKASGQPLRHRVDVFGSGNADFALEPEWVETVEQSYRSRTEITLAGMLQDADQSASASGALGQLIASGSLVHFHLHLNQSGLKDQQPDAQFVRWLWKKVIQGQAPLAVLLNVSLFAREDRDQDLQQQWSGFLFERFVQAIVAAAQEQVANHYSGTDKHLSIAVHSGRYLNHGPKDGIIFSEDIPVEYSPGSALVGSLLLRSLVSESVATGAQAQGSQLNTLIGENVSQREFFSGLWSVLFHGESLAKDVAATGVLEPSVEVSDAVAAQDPLKVIAFVHGAHGVLQVFSDGWIFLPRSAQGNLGLQESNSSNEIPNEPLFGIGLDRVAEARRLMFAAAKGRGQVALELFFPGVDSGEIGSAEIRSEFPVSRCGSSDSRVTFANGFGFDGAMTVTISVGDEGQESRNAGGLATRVHCIFDTARPNPIPKRASMTELEQFKIDAASPQRLRRRSSPPNVSVRFMKDGSRVQTSEITVGPYGEPAQRNLAADPLSSRTTVSFDILKDRDRLLRVWGSAPVFQPGLHSIWLRGVGASETEQSWSDAGPLAVTTDWEDEVDEFVDRRIKQAQKPRQND